MGTQRFSPRLLIFDLDGTLLDTYETICAVYNQTMPAYGVATATVDEIRPRVGGGVRGLLAPVVRVERLEEAVTAFRRLYRVKLYEGTRPYPAVPALVAWARGRGLKLGVASNKPQVLTELLLEHFGLRASFDAVVCGDGAGKLKPDPHILQVILARCAVAPADAVYIGDTTVDIETARRAGMRVVAVTTGSDPREALAAAAPDGLIDDLDELRTLLSDGTR